MFCLLRDGINYCEGYCGILSWLVPEGYCEGYCGSRELCTHFSPV